ncbi:MAG: UbiA family prenyltransferase [Ignavibacterium sp.]
MFKERINILFELTKIRITLFVMITSGFGFILAKGNLSSQIIIPILGVFLLACGSAAINQIQERKTDALMRRTKNRPLPSGKIKLKTAVLISIILILFGSVFLLISSGVIALSLGILNVIWYNLIYTPLKKVTPLAIIPGSLIGAIPPVIGWVAGKGDLFDPTILIVAFFFFIWQIPHFWLLILNFSDDYENAGLPTLIRIFNKNQLARITFFWISATALTSLLLPFFDVIKISYSSYAILLLAIILILNSIKLLKSELDKFYYRFAFREINIFVLLVILFVSLDKIIIIL